MKKIDAPLFLTPGADKFLPNTKSLEKGHEGIVSADNNSDSRLGLLVVKGAVKKYGDLTALDRVNLRVEKGEFVALLGLNGAGKTTLFSILTGLFVPDEGSVELNGYRMQIDPVASLRGLGIVFQEATLDLDLSVAASMHFHAGLHGMGREQAKIRISEELGRLGLKDRLGDSARKLSGGNRRRVELARALIHDPNILLLDEPTVGLDPATRVDILDYALKLKERRQIGILWATHLIDEAERADRVVILHEGRIVENDHPQTLIEKSRKDDLSSAFLYLIGED